MASSLPGLVLFGLLTLIVSQSQAQGSPLWQQRVAYEMDVRLLTDRHLVEGRQRLQYENNSPDTLRTVFYHLYFNAFHSRSMMAERNRHLPDPDRRIAPRIFDLGPNEIGYHRIQALSQNGRPVSYEIDDTVMKVELAEPIPPGGRAVFEMDFFSQVPLQTRRSGRDNREGIDYSMSQWYPKMANYDERGWHADPYVGREFYAPFGTFDVRITLPADYVIASTGILQNPSEIGHGYGPHATPEIDSLTWHFRAENVHDFAWSADPDYLHEMIEGEDGVTYHLIYQKNVADRWEEMSEWVPAIFEFYSRKYGPYPYPQFTVAQAGDGGMEYPMITFVVGDIPPRGLLSVTAHEAAHMWYYGALGSNEADYAWMDEGFASYAERNVLAHIAGRAPAHVASHLGVLRYQSLDLFERMNTPADWFETNAGYSIASYTAGEMLLDMLGYVISDSLRDRFLLEYFDRFKFRHPNPYDVEKVAEDVSGLHLDWYFDQITSSSWVVDYAVGNVRSERTAGGWESTIEIEREGGTSLPVDLRLTLADDSVLWVNIPLSIMRGHKPVPDDWIVANPWQWPYPTYTLRVEVPSRVVNVEIDPLLKTPEANRLNNTARLPIRFAFLQPPSPSWTTYDVGWRPLAQYAHEWGLGGGVQFRGTYIFDRFRTRATVKFWPEVLFSNGEEPDLGGRRIQTELSSADGIDFDFSVSSQVDALGANTIVGLQSQKHLGIWQNEASASFLLNKHDMLTIGERRLRLSVKHQQRTSDRALFTRVSDGFLSERMLSAAAELSLRTSDRRVLLFAETGGALSGGGEGRNANRISVDAARAFPLRGFTGLIHIRAGLGSDLLAYQKQYRLGAASYEHRWANDAYRMIGAAFEDPLGEIHWVAFDGPGPIAYLRREERLTGIVLDAPLGARLLAASGRLITPRAGSRGLLRPLRLDLFFGIGNVGNSGNFIRRNLLMDAGLGARYNVSEMPGLGRWVGQSDVLSGLNLIFRMPFWASDPEFTDERDALAFRWLFGVSVDDLPWE